MKKKIIYKLPISKSSPIYLHFRLVSTTTSPQSPTQLLLNNPNFTKKKSKFIFDARSKINHISFEFTRPYSSRCRWNISNTSTRDSGVYKGKIASNDMNGKSSKHVAGNTSSVKDTSIKSDSNKVDIPTSTPNSECLEFEWADTDTHNDNIETNTIDI